jgi:hypothetical protein
MYNVYYTGTTNNASVHFLKGPIRISPGSWGREAVTSLCSRYDICSYLFMPKSIQIAYT